MLGTTKSKSVHVSVRLSVCAHFNSRNYSSNVLNFMCVIHIWYYMHRVENGMCRTRCLSTDQYKIFPIQYDLREKRPKISKIFRYLLR